MRRKSLTPLGETEMEVLHHVWALERATVAQVRERILAERQVAYTTIMTVMRNLADKGYLAYEKEGATYVYRPLRSREEVRQGLLERILDKVFDGSAAALIQTLVRRESLSGEEIDEICNLIEQLDDHAHR